MQHFTMLSTLSNDNSSSDTEDGAYEIEGTDEQPKMLKASLTQLTIYQHLAIKLFLLYSDDPIAAEEWTP